MHYAKLLHCLWDLSHACMSHFVRMCCCMPRVLLRCVPGMSLVLLWDFCHIPLVFLSDSSNWILDLGPGLSLDLGLRPSLHLDRPGPRPRPSTSRSPGMALSPSPQLPGLQPPDDQLPTIPMLSVLRFPGFAACPLPLALASARGSSDSARGGSRGDCRCRG